MVRAGTDRANPNATVCGRAGPGAAAGAPRRASRPEPVGSPDARGHSRRRRTARTPAPTARPSRRSRASSFGRDQLVLRDLHGALTAALGGGVSRLAEMDRHAVVPGETHDLRAADRHARDVLDRRGLLRAPGRSSPRGRASTDSLPLHPPSRTRERPDSYHRSPVLPPLGHQRPGRHGFSSGEQKRHHQPARGRPVILTLAPRTSARSMRTVATDRKGSARVTFQVAKKAILHALVAATASTATGGSTGPMPSRPY
jgi:hypothetical protein